MPPALFDIAEAIRDQPAGGVEADNLRRVGVDGRISQRRRKRFGEIFGWTSAVGVGEKLRYLGMERNHLWLKLTPVAYTVVRTSQPVAVQA